jgi:hypothetical protein
MHQPREAQLKKPSHPRSAMTNKFEHLRRMKVKSASTISGGREREGFTRAKIGLSPTKRASRRRHDRVDTVQAGDNNASSAADTLQGQTAVGVFPSNGRNAVSLFQEQ